MVRVYLRSLSVVAKRKGYLLAIAAGFIAVVRRAVCRSHHTSVVAEPLASGTTSARKVQVSGWY